MFAGFRDELDSILACLDLVVHPATKQGLDVSLLEAAAAQDPIVATRVGGIPEIVRHRQNSLLVRQQDSAALAEAIIGVLPDQVAARHMEQEGENMVARRFSIDKMTTGNCSVYQSVLSKQPAKS